MTGGRRRRVLMVMYLFPPLGGVAAARNVRMAHHLPSHGWEPVVVTPRDPAYRIRDESLVKLIPPTVEVVRTRSLEVGHIRRLASTVAARAQRRPAAGDAARPDGGLESEPRAAAPSRSPRSSRRSDAAGSLRSTVGAVLRVAAFPDEEAGWLPFAVAASLRAHRDAPVDALFSTSSPITSHLIAGIVKRRTGLPWIAEFRDPWVGNVLAPRHPWLVQRLRRKLEAWVARSADAIVCVTPTLAETYARRYPAARVRTITNGYDRTEAGGRRRSATVGDPFRIVFTGTLDRPLELDTFLGGLELLVARRPALRDHLRVSFYGVVSSACRLVFDGHAAGALDGVVQLCGFVPRADAAAAVSTADAALVLLGDGPGMNLFVGGKLYDYLGQDTQVFAMVPDGDARRVLEGLGWGVVADPDPASVEAAIERLIALPAPAGRADPTGRYDRARLAGELAALLDEAVEAADDVP
jgi:glycosyltransferase involved in cell wall biosynthesis